MKHGIRRIPPAEGCLLLFIFVYTFAPFPSQCCVEEGKGVAKTAGSLRCGKFCVFWPFYSLAFPCLHSFIMPFLCFYSTFSSYDKEETGPNVEFVKYFTLHSKIPKFHNFTREKRINHNICGKKLRIGDGLLSSFIFTCQFCTQMQTNSIYFVKTIQYLKPELGKLHRMANFLG